MLGLLPNDFKEGDTVSARELNQMLAVLRMFAKLIVEQPLEMKAGSAGIVLSAPNIKRSSSGGTFIDFTTTGAFAADEATATVDRVWGGTATTVGASVTIRTEGGVLNGVLTGFTGSATYDSAISKFRYLPDRRVAVEDTNTPGVLKDQFENFNAVAQYVALQDYDIDFENTGSNPNKNIRGFIDANAISNWPSGTAASLGKDTSNNATWIQHLGSIWIQIIFSGSDFTATHIGPFSGETSVEIGATMNKPTGAANTTSHDFTTSADAGRKWALTAWYQPIAGGNVDIYGGLTSYDSKGHAFLLGGEVLAGTITMPAASADVKMAVVAASTAGRLEDIATSWNAIATFELNNDELIYFENNAGEFLAYSDSSTITGYSSSVDQFKGHSATAEMTWFTVRKKAGAIAVTLGTGGLSTGSALGNASGFTLDDSWGSQEDTVAPTVDASLIIEDDAGLFVRALSAAKTIAVLDRVDDVYRAVASKSKAGWIVYTTTSTFSGSPTTATATINNYGGTQQDVQNPTAASVIDLTGQLNNVAPGHKGVAIYDNELDRYIDVSGPRSVASTSLEYGALAYGGVVTSSDGDVDVTGYAVSLGNGCVIGSSTITLVSSGKYLMLGRAAVNFSPSQSSGKPNQVSHSHELYYAVDGIKRTGGFTRCTIISERSTIEHFGFMRSEELPAGAVIKLRFNPATLDTESNFNWDLNDASLAVIRMSNVSGFAPLITAAQTYRRMNIPIDHDQFTHQQQRPRVIPS